MMCLLMITEENAVWEIGNKGNSSSRSSRDPDYTYEAVLAAWSLGRGIAAPKVVHVPLSEPVNTVGSPTQRTYGYRWNLGC